MRLLVTGGAGFVGTNLVRLLLAETRYRVVNLDLLTYAGNLDNFKGANGLMDANGLMRTDGGGRHRFVHGDICDEKLVRELAEGVDAIVNVAAESHVDRSIAAAAPFVRTNVMGTQSLLAAALEVGTPRFVQVSTDEVYGSLGEDGRFTEETPLAPRSPYSASKAGGDLLAMAYHATYGLDVVVTRCSNNYGPYQFPEKLVPLSITNAIRGRSIPLYGDGLHVRDWIHVHDHCRGILAALERGRAGEAYNFGAESERTNSWIVNRIVADTEAARDLVTTVTDRPGHDRRYAVDPSKAMRELEWAPRVSLEDGLPETVAWYRENEWWWRRIESGEYANAESRRRHGRRA